MGKSTRELYQTLSIHLDWNKARLMCFVGMLIAMFAVKTINLKAIAIQYDSKAKIDSRYKRLQRFFKLFNPDISSISLFIFKWFNFNIGKHYLIIDRTNWKLGKSNINILMLSINYGGISIPILWKNIGRAGNSTTAQRIELIDKYISQFGVNNISGILGDREFIGEEWFQYLIDKNIPILLDD